MFLQTVGKVAVHIAQKSEYHHLSTETLTGLHVNFQNFKIQPKVFNGQLKKFRKNSQKPI